MSHDYHEGLPGYRPAQLYYDGCTECEQRTKDLILAIQHVRSLRDAWRRACLFEKGSLGGDEVSEAEAPLLRLIWAMAVRFERQGIPLGVYPPDAVSSLIANLTMLADAIGPSTDTTDT
jgi:hypothetical protein